MQNKTPTEMAGVFENILALT